MKTVRLSELSQWLVAQGFPNRKDGSADPLVRGVNTLHEAQDGEISFLSNPRYRAQLLETRASAVIVCPDEPVPDGMTVLRCEDPYGAVAAVIRHVHGVRRHPRWGLSPRAEIAESVRIGANPNIGPFVTIDADVTIGDNATIYPGCYIGKGAVIGDDAILYPNVVIYDGSLLGHRVTVHAGSVIGEDGLGYAPVEGRWVKIPQAGRAVIEDDVEMGACCAVDRATLGETRVGAGTKFSDQVVIGHGTKVGQHGMFVAQVGLAGSVTVGDHVTIGGQVGVAGHLNIGDHVTIGAKSGIWSDLASGERYFGNPAFKWKQFWRQVAAVKELPELLRRLRKLEHELQFLHARRVSNE